MARSADKGKIKLAIAVQKYQHPGQSFVNRHLAHLFGGNSCVIAERRYRHPDPTTVKPHFYVGRAAMNAHDLIRLPYHLWRNDREHHVFRVPFGRHRAALKAFLRDEGADAILSEFGSQSMLVADLGNEMGLPVFCYFRGRDASFWLNSKKRVAAYEKVFSTLAGVFCVSQFLADNLARSGLTHPNTHIIPSGTDIDHFKPSQKDPGLILAVGRLVEKKNPQLTIRAFASIMEKFPEAKLEMIGGGPSLNACRKLVEELGAGAHITLHGKQDSNFIAKRLASASAFIQHSVMDKKGEAEGLPSSIQEAMAAGCAILSTEHAGIPELVVPGETGYLSAEHDEEGFANALGQLLHEPEATALMGKRARKIAEERLDYRKLYAKVEEVISAAIN